MARPRTVSARYFPLDVQVFSDVKVRQLRRKMGAEGVELFLRLLCSIYSDNTGFCLRVTPLHILDYVEYMGLSEDEIKAAIGFMVETGLFDEGIYSRYGILTSHSIQLRFQEMLKGRVRKNSSPFEVDGELWLLDGGETISCIVPRRLSGERSALEGGSANAKAENGVVKEDFEGEENKETAEGDVAELCESDLREETAEGDVAELCESDLREETAEGVVAESGFSYENCEKKEFCGDFSEKSVKIPLKERKRKERKGKEIKAEESRGKESAKSSAAAAAALETVDFYENTIGKASGNVVRGIEQHIKNGVEPALIIRLIEYALEQGKPTWQYVNAAVIGNISDGILTLEAYKQSRKTAKSRGMPSVKRSKFNNYTDTNYKKGMYADFGDKIIEDMLRDAEEEERAKQMREALENENHE